MWAEFVDDLMKNPDRHKFKPEDTHHLRVDFGKFRGERWTRLPSNYLRWLVNSEHPQAYIARAELKRRGSDEMPDVEITAHAVDRASQHCLELWQRTRKGDEGLHSWLRRVMKEAIALNQRNNAGHYLWRGRRFVIYDGTQYPILKTIVSDGFKEKEGEA